LNSQGKLLRVIVLSQGTPQSLASKMTVAFTLGSPGNFVAFGSVPRSGLSSLASLPQVERVFPDVPIRYNDTRLDQTGGGLLQTDMFRIRQITGVNAVNSTLHLQGDGVKVAIVDTGTDFANPNMKSAYARDINGVPIALDPDGAGIVLTNSTVHKTVNSTGVYLDMIRGGAGTSVSIYLGAVNYPQVVFPVLWLLTNYKIGTSLSNYIVSKSGNYHFGIAFEWTPGNVQSCGCNLYFFPTLVVDSKTAGVYDTVYVDMHSAPLLSEYLFAQVLPNDNLARWSFLDDSPHHIGDGTEVLSASLGKSGVPDISAGLLGARVLDVFGAIVSSHTKFDFDLGALNGSLLAPMDPNGKYYGVMYDFAGHGSQTASNVASSGTTPYNVYGNGTLYRLPGVAPHAKIIPVKALWIGDILYGWMWTSGFDYSAALGRWVYSGNHKADIVSNSWGTSEWPLFDAGLGFDVVSLLEDALSVPHTLSSQYPGTVFVQAMGNGGPGYGTITSPASSSFAISVGASTSWHVASQFSSSGLPYYGGQSSYSGDVVGWSDRGPGITGEPKPDVVNVGAFGFTPRAVMEARGNVSAEWGFFGGTSQATPLTAGVAALVIQALESKGEKVSPGLVKQILMSTAKDLGYDAFVQGAGQVNASAAASLALRGSSLLNGAFTVGTQDTYSTLDKMLSQSTSSLTKLLGQPVSFPSTPVPTESWFAGSVTPGGSGATTFTITNPSSEAVDVSVSSATYKLIGSANFSETSNPGKSVYVDLTKKAGPIPAGTTLMVVREYFPFNTWYNRTISPYFADDVTRLRLQVFNWVDKDRDGVVQQSEVALINTDYAWANTEEARVSTPLAKFTGTPVLGIYQNPIRESYWFSGINFTAKPVDFKVSIFYYQRVPWQVVSFDKGVHIPAGSNASITATLSVPSDATPGTYEGYIELRGSTGQATQIPVSYVVPIVPTLKGVPYVFGGAKSADSLYNNGATYGASDFSWRYESGNWRAYQVKVTDPTVNQGSVKVQWTSPMTSINIFVIDPQGRIVATSVPPGLYKSITRNFVSFPLPLPQASPSNDWLGYSYYNLRGWGGGFVPSQNNGQNSSIVQFPINETGTYTVVVHNTLYSGLTPNEPFVGEVELNTVKAISSPPSLTVNAPTTPVRGTVPIPINVIGQDISNTTITVDLKQVYGFDKAGQGQGTFYLDTTKLSDGPHLVVVTATDTVGFTAVKSFQLVVLNTPPAVVISSPINGSTVRGQVQVAFLVKTNYLSNVTAKIDGTPISGLSGSYVWNSAAAPDGSHVLTVTATDQAGNVRTVVSRFTTDNLTQNVIFWLYVGGAAVAGAIVTLLVLRLRRPDYYGFFPPP